jgi:hypothetical protein
LDLARKNPKSHFFLDEVPFGDPGVDTEFFLELEKTISKDYYLWIACKRNMKPNKNKLDGKYFFFYDLYFVFTLNFS